MPIQPTLLCGGSGSRLWPLSREAYPKHLVPLIDGQSLFQLTLNRLNDLQNGMPSLVITNHDQRFLVAQQVQESDVSYEKIILEPAGRNTAAAVAIAAWQCQHEDPSRVLLVLAADHIILREAEFLKCIEQAHLAAQKGKLVTFGITPTSPHTGYGYIAKEDAFETGFFKIKEFVEKPTLEKAKAYVAAGYLWNSGMFMFRADTYLEELQTYAPEIYTATKEAVALQTQDLDFIRLNEAAFAKSPDEPIDTAVMEKTQKGLVIPADIGWSDVGDWKSLKSVLPHDEQNNVLSGDVLAEKTENSLIFANHRLVAAVGLEDHIVVETADAVLVAHQNANQEVKKVVKRLKDANRTEPLHHLTQYRPWGRHTLLVKGKGFEVRQVTIFPGKKIGAQQHQLRSEHWVVVSGEAELSIDNEKKCIKHNESWFAPPGSKHVIHNPGKANLVFIEVQIGECLKEDDVVRYDV